MTADSATCLNSNVLDSVRCRRPDPVPSRVAYHHPLTEFEKQQAALAKERKQQVGSGDRSEKIRTYNFPQNRLSDHRIGLTIHQLTDVMDGKLQPIVDAVVSHFQAEKLKHEAA